MCSRTCRRICCVSKPCCARNWAERMANMNMIQALNSAMDIMLGRNPAVLLMGEDIGYFGGVFRATECLQHKYGEHRVTDTPLAKGTIVATAIGMSVNG